MLLERFCFGPPGIGTFGRLFIGKQQFYTVEREWADNKPFVSCLPAGDYRLEKIMSPRWGNTYALTQDAGRVTIGAQAHSLRYGCIIHAANRAAELMGCIAPGDSLGIIKGEWAVLNSNNALRALLGAIATSGEDALRIARRADTDLPAHG